MKKIAISTCSNLSTSAFMSAVCLIFGLASLASGQDSYDGQSDEYGTPIGSVGKLPEGIAGPSDDLFPGLKYPVALMLSHNNRDLYVLNERSADVVRVDLKEGKPKEAWKVGTRPVAWWFSPERDKVWIVDRDEHKVSQWSVNEGAFVEERQFATSQYPVDVVLTEDMSIAIVAGLWSQRLDFIETNSELDSSTTSLDLPFAPGKLALIDNDRFVVVASEFGGRLAIVDLEHRKVRAVHELPAHNLRGMIPSPDGKSILIAHQMLNELAHTVRNDVHWGLLMSNELRWIPSKALLDKVDLSRDGYVETSRNGDFVIDLYHDAHTVPVGQTGDGGGDPGAVVVTPRDQVAIVLSGIGEIALGKKTDYRLRRVSVGKRPVALAMSKYGDRLYVANQFEDSISVVNVGLVREVDRIWLGKLRDLSLEEQGEQLFFDATLSHDRWMSCHSCHTNGHTNGLLNDNFSDQSFGAPKRVLSLLGKADTLPLAWNGKVESFEEQVQRSIRDTMQKDSAPTEHEMEAITAFVKTLEPAPGVSIARNDVDHDAVEKGHALFQSLNCNKCHQAPTYTNPGAFDVGLQDEEGNTEFNPPSLRGVSQRPSYFHDGRHERLHEIFTVSGHQLDRELSERELEILLAFLNTL